MTGWFRVCAALAFAGSLLAAAPGHTAEGPRFTVRAFEIEGDLPIPRERALAILAPYTGVAVRIEDLQTGATLLEA